MPWFARPITGTPAGTPRPLALLPQVAGGFNAGPWPVLAQARAADKVARGRGKGTSMRLSCPSCEAQYEVPADAIPPAGRDVQCSACGQGWFEQPAESRPRLVDPEPWDSLPREEGGEEEADDLAELRAAPPLPPEAPAARARVTPEVERILREEAAHEAQARAEDAARRAAPAPVPEIEPDVPQIARPARVVSRETERPTPRPLPPDPAPAARSAARPARQVDRPIDLDRINSTLRSHGDQVGAKAPQVGRTRRRRAGFAGGFWGALAVLAVLAVLYIFRLQIVEVVPQSAAVLDPYARFVDQGRFWLDHEVGRLLGVTPGA